MEILNKNGMILMDYRREFKRHYADSVDEALKDAILTLYKEGQIPEKLFRIILDDSVDDSVVYTYLLSRREFTKSSMELNSEFNEVREKVNDYLIKINFVKNVCTKNSVNTNRIYIIRQYDIPKELLLSYFGLTPAEIIPLMKRKGFMDKFCVLRLSQAFKEIYSELKVPEHIDHGYSLIYYNKLIQGFSIDYKYMVSINYINDPDRLKDVVDKIKELDSVVEKQFESKMSYSYFRQLDKKMNISELASEIEKIVIPVRSGKRNQDIRRPQLIVDDAEPGTNSVGSIDTKKPKSPSPILVVEDDPVEVAEPKVVAPKKDVVKVDEKKVPDTTNKVDTKKEPEVVNENKNDNKQKQQGQKNQPKPTNNQNQQNAKKDNQPVQQDNKNKQQNNSNKPNENKQKQPQKQNDQKQDKNKNDTKKGNDVVEDAKPSEVVKETKPEVKQNTKPAKVEDDILEDIISAPTKPKKDDNNGAGGKPVLVMDDDDLDLI